MAYLSEAADSSDASRVGIVTELDIVTARQRARELALRLGFSSTDATVIATAVSELARNITEYAAPGEVIVCPVVHGGRRGLLLMACDHGPGIEDVAAAMRDGFSTGGRLGLGLPGVRRLMDQFEIRSGPGQGTTVIARKWLDTDRGGGRAPRSLWTGA